MAKESQAQNTSFRAHFLQILSISSAKAAVFTRRSAQGLWGVDIFNEIWNSMICFISGYAPVWGTPVGVGNTAWLLMIGYNIEISFMFLIMGITCCLMLTKDPKAKILGFDVILIIICACLGWI